MKFITLSSFFIFLLSPVLWAQKSSQSTAKSYSIKPKIEPPILSLVEGSLRFQDQNSNQAMDAQETCSIRFDLKNEGMGDGINVVAKIEIQGSSNGISIASQQALPRLLLGKTTSIEIPLTSNMNTVKGMLNLKIHIIEPNGFDLQPFSMSIETRAFQSPEVRITDFAISGEGKLEPKKQFTLQFMLQNTGQGMAENIKTELILPDGNVYVLEGEVSQSIPTLASGESRKMEYTLIINARYTQPNLPVSLKLAEKYGRYAQNWQNEFQLNQTMSAPRELVVQAAAQQTKSIETASFKSDVDLNIPVNPVKKTNRYALVIGNEDYASRNGSLNKSINVDFAIQDAQVYAQYLQSAFGIPAQNIKLLTNATSGEMLSGISWIENNARAYGAEAELYFFYSGHGLPDETNRNPYLIPVDIAGDRPELGIALNNLYEALTRHPVKKITVVLDACFSGGARNQELIARKGVRVQPKSGSVKGNMVVLTSSSGNQSSGVYTEKSHGYLTYFLLKEIQTRGIDTQYGILFEEAARKVDLETARKGMVQQPQILPAAELAESWKTWSVQ